MGVGVAAGVGVRVRVRVWQPHAPCERDHLHLLLVGHAGLLEVLPEVAVDQADRREVLHAWFGFGFGFGLGLGLGLGFGFGFGFGLGFGFGFGFGLGLGFGVGVGLGKFCTPAKPISLTACSSLSIRRKGSVAHTPARRGVLVRFRVRVGLREP